MAAQTGVSEGSPGEPVDPARQAEPADGELVTVELSEAEIVEAEIVPAGELADTEPVEAGTADTEPVAAGDADTEPVQTGLAEPGVAGEEPAEAGPAEAGPAEAGPAEAGPAEAGPAEAGPAEAGPAEAGESGRDISPLAVFGVVLGVIALVGIAIGELAVLPHGLHTKTVVTYRPAAVFKLRPGQCVNSGSDALSFTLMSCSKPHDAEVFATFALTGSAWPGDATVQQEAGNGCASRLGSYLNPQLANAGLAQEYVYPNESAWKAGERDVVCEVSSPTGPLTGSVRG
jgi:hypothetical protein